MKDLSQLILAGRIKDITLTLRTSGRGKGKIYVEHSLHTPEEEQVSLTDRYQASAALLEIAEKLKTKQKFTFLVFTKNVESQQYFYTIHKEVKFDTHKDISSSK